MSPSNIEDAHFVQLKLKISLIHLGYQAVD